MSSTFTVLGEKVEQWAGGRRITTAWAFSNERQARAKADELRRLKKGPACHARKIQVLSRSLKAGGVDWNPWVVVRTTVERGE